MAAAFDIDAGAVRTRIHPTGHAGPTSYTQLAGGGDTCQAVEFGMKWITRVVGGLTSDGNYRVEAVNPTAAPVGSLALLWIDVTTGFEVGPGTDLHLSSVNLQAFGW